MKKIIFLVLAFVLAVSTPTWALSQALNAGYQGGITDGYQYHEVIFLSGEPIQVKGTYRLTPGRLRNDRISDRHVYELTNVEKDIKISRSITLTTEFQKNNGQTIEITEVDRFTETITIGGIRYRLLNFEHSQSILRDHQPAADYYSGSWYSKKIYSINNVNTNTIEVISMGNVVGYSNKWSYTETQTIENMIEERGGENPWKGTYTLQMSTSRNKDLTFIANEPTQISFRGQYTEVDRGESILKAKYSLPDKNEGEFNVYTSTVPQFRSLPLKTIRDIGGHWAEKDIVELYSMGILNSPSEYFGPLLTMTRGEFAKGIALAIGLEYDPNGVQEEFIDITAQTPDHQLIRAITQRGIIRGTAPGVFSPDSHLTRATAITIMIRALGLENLAPAEGYKTVFKDDAQIPIWAKDSMYVAYEIGLLRGDGTGMFNPKQSMSKAEAATFLNRFVNHLRHEITPDYRERLLK